MAKSHKYSYRPDTSGNSVAFYTLNFLSSGNRILEVGAGPGTITREIKGLSEDYHILAIENDTSSHEELSEYADEIKNLDLNASDWDAALLNDEKFDTVLALDVIEHLMNPWEVVSKCAGLLNPEGELILSIPHIGHAGIIGCQMQSSFPYQPVGLLDRTHIRFFGLDDLEELLDDAGLEVSAAHFVMRHPRQTELSYFWRKLNSETKQCLLSNPSCYIYQIVVKAKHKQSAQSSPRLRSLFEDSEEFQQLHKIQPEPLLRKLKYKVLEYVHPRHKISLSRLFKQL